MIWQRSREDRWKLDIEGGLSLQLKEQCFSATEPRIMIIHLFAHDKDGNDNLPGAGDGSRPVGRPPVEDYTLPPSSIQ